MEGLATLGKILGIAGVSLGLMLLIFRDVIRKVILVRLPAAESYKLMRLVLVLTWTVAVLGIMVWFSKDLKVIIGNGNSWIG